MLSRRALLATALVCPLPAVMTSARAASATIKVGTLPFGTAGWEVAIIKARKLDEANGFTLQPVKLAGNDAARIAFQGGQVDTIVGDLIWAARMSGEGRPVKFTPYSTTEGALMVPPGSPITSLKDLSGKRLGVAGGALDKNWLLLKAQAREAAGLDLETGTQLAFGAPPLLAQKLESGELDASLLYWMNCARLEAKGFTRLVGADDIMRALGAQGAVSLIGYLFAGATVSANEAAVRGFVQASRAAKDVLATEPEAWNIVRPLMAAEDDTTFETLKRNFLAGIPRRPVEAERADGERMFEALARLGGESLVGANKTLPQDLYLDVGRNG